MEKLILGTVQMGLNYGINNSKGQISFKESCKILSKAFDIGIKTLDTAEAYGNAHQIIGQFHQLNPSIKFEIITKIPHKIDAKNIDDSIEKYIKDLNVGYLDVLMFHSFESYINNNQIVEKLINLKNQGKIKKIGVSVYTNQQIEKLIDDDTIDVVQLPFNLLDNENLRGKWIQKLKNSNKIIHSRSAFLQGLFFKEEFIDAISKSLSKELNEVKSITKYANTTISNLALSYCLSQKNIDNVLIGVDSVEQLIENYNAANYKIQDETISKINTIKVENIDLLNPSLWK